MSYSTQPKKKVGLAWLSMILALLMLLSACGGKTAGSSASSGAVTAEQTVAPALTDDFYDSINFDALAALEIKDDQSTAGNMTDMANAVNDRQYEIIKKQAEAKKLAAGSDEANIAALYTTGVDTAARDAGGYGPTLEGHLTQVRAAKTLKELMELDLRFGRTYGGGMLFGFDYAASLENASVRVLAMGSPSGGMDKSVWQDKEKEQRYLSLIKDLLVQYGYSAEKAESMCANTVKVMRTVADAELSPAELYDPEKRFEVTTGAAIPEISNGMLSAELVKELYNLDPEDTLYLNNPAAVHAAAALMTEENLDMIRDYVVTRVILTYGAFADTASAKRINQYDAETSGLEAVNTVEEAVLGTVAGRLSFEVGRLYCKQYVPEQTREDILALVDEMKAMYDTILANADWLSEETRTAAREKLAAIHANAVCPRDDEWPQDGYDLMLTGAADGGLYIENLMELSRVENDYSSSLSDEPINKEEWNGGAPQGVNAFYDPSSNQVTILAGILQEPMYSPNYTAEQNLGGIGMVIAHELSHAFDNNGAKYDKDGNVADWWTAEDKEHFKELSQKVVDYYSGMEVNGMKVNGEQTLGENIADLGSLSCITAVAKQKGYDLKEVYRQFAMAWLSKERPEYRLMLAQLDTHSPDKVRVNATLSATDGFYEAYDVKEGDGMYVAPENRPKIW